MSAAENRLKKWLTSQELTSKHLSQERILLTDYLDDEERQRIAKVLKTFYQDKQMDDLIEETLENIHPFAMVAHSQFQAITDEVFTIDGIAFASRDVCALIKKSEFVFPHIISTGKEIEDYALEHPDSMHRQIMRHVCSQVHLFGQNLIVEELVKRYHAKNLLPLLPGEPGWNMFEGIRIFDLFNPIPQDHNLFLTKKGYPNVANTSFGLFVGN